MGFAETVLLGAIAGFTIYIGLPIGRLHAVDDRLRVALAMFSVGILAFIFMDVTNHGEAIVASSLTASRHGHTAIGHVLGLFALLAVGFTAGTAGIAAIERRLRRRARAARRRSPAAAQTAALSAVELSQYSSAAADAPAPRAADRDDDRGSRSALHNFAEGLAIGVVGARPARSASRPC